MTIETLREATIVQMHDWARGQRCVAAWFSIRDLVPEMTFREHCRFGALVWCEPGDPHVHLTRCRAMQLHAIAVSPM